MAYPPLGRIKVGSQGFPLLNRSIEAPSNFPLKGNFFRITEDVKDSPLKRRGAMGVIKQGHD